MGGFSKINVRKLARQQGGKCHYCPAPLNFGRATHKNPDAATRDHVVPRSKMKGLMIGNIVAACWWCNHHKGDMDAEKFRAALPALWFKHGRKFP